MIEASKEHPIYGHLLLLTGANSDRNDMLTLAQMPFASPHWQMGQAYIHLPDASGRLLIPDDNIQVAYRALELEIRVEDATDCDDLKLRWERPAGVVVSAFADQPYREWGSIDDAGTPPLMAAVVEGTDATSALGVLRDGGVKRATSTAEGHITLPARCSGPQVPGTPDIGCVRSDARQWIVFAIRSDLAHAAALSDMRETGSTFNARSSFNDPSAETVGGVGYQIYVSKTPWFAERVFGVEWSLR